MEVASSGCPLICPYCSDKYVRPLYRMKEGEVIFESVGVTSPDTTDEVLSVLREITEMMSSQGVVTVFRTNGMNPDLLEKVLTMDIVPVIEVTIKASANNFHRICKGYSWDSIGDTAKYAKYLLRTIQLANTNVCSRAEVTVFPSLIDIDNASEVAKDYLRFFDEVVIKNPVWQREGKTYIALCPDFQMCIYEHGQQCKLDEDEWILWNEYTDDELVLIAESIEPHIKGITMIGG